jgi:hypothetical protein
MGTRDDANLSAQERAALADLEASASAEDPRLAALLGGSGRMRALLRLGMPLGSAPPAGLRLLGRVHLPAGLRLPRAMLASCRLPSPRLPSPPAWMRSRWWGVPAALVGLVLVVLSLSITWALGVAGALVAAGGMWLMARELDDRSRGRSRPPG